MSVPTGGYPGVPPVQKSFPAKRRICRGRNHNVKSRTSPSQLEEARAQIEAVGRQGKRYKQTDAAKQRDDRESVRLGFGS